METLVRNALRDPIPEIFEAASRLAKAAKFHSLGKHKRAAEQILQADKPAIAEWTESIWGKRDQMVHGFISIAGAPPYLNSRDCLSPRMPSVENQKTILKRDGFHCRFCGIPVIHSAIRNKLRKLYPIEARWGRRNVEQHAALQCMWLQFDHILPYTRGGTSSVENVLITCAPCNFGRMEATLDEARLTDPRSRKVTASWSGHAEWNGLQAFA